MKLKTQLKTIDRVAGAVETGAGYLALKYAAYSFGFLSQINYQKCHDFFTGDYDPLHKLGVGAAIVGIALIGTFASSVGLFFMIDGCTDIIKGTHHYFGLRTWQKLTKSEKRKRDIERDINRQLIAIGKKELSDLV